MPKTENSSMPITRKGLWILLMGLVVMISGMLLMMGGAPDDPKVFNWSIFDFRRMVAAPVVIFCGVAIMIFGIMRHPKVEKEDGR